MYPLRSSRQERGIPMRKSSSPSTSRLIEPAPPPVSSIRATRLSISGLAVPPGKRLARTLRARRGPSVAWRRSRNFDGPMNWSSKNGLSIQGAKDRSRCYRARLLCRAPQFSAMRCESRFQFRIKRYAGRVLILHGPPEHTPRFPEPGPQSVSLKRVIRLSNSVLAVPPGKRLARNMRDRRGPNLA